MVGSTFNCFEQLWNWNAGNQQTYKYNGSALQRKRKLPKGAEMNSSAHVANVELHPSTIIAENTTKKNEMMQCYKGHQNTCLSVSIGKQCCSGNIL